MKPKKTMPRFVNSLLVICGFLCLALGLLGLVVPVLPAPPLLILSTLCFAKGSERFYKLVTDSKLYKEHLENFIKNRSMTLKAKFVILITATIIQISICVMVDVFAFWIAIIALLLIKYWFFIFKVKTIKDS